MLNLLNFRLLLIFLTSLVLVSCGSKDGSSSGSSSVRIKMPEQLRSSKLNSSAGILELSQAPGDEFNDIWATSFQPENTAQLNCFGVVVGGPDESLRSNKCRFSGGSDLVYGVQFMGALPGETVSIAVPSGEDREIRILAWQAENEAACQSLTQGAAVESRQLSHPFVIATAVQNLEPGDVSLTIDASLEDAQELINCDVFVEKIGSLSTRSFNLGGEIINNKPADIPGDNLELELVLQPNFGQNAQAAIHTETFTQDGAFTFDFPISDGQLFTVSITQQPAGKDCSVENEQGIIFGDSVIGPVIECEDVPFKVGGVVVGLDEDAPITEELELGFIIGGDLPFQRPNNGDDGQDNGDDSTPPPSPEPSPEPSPGGDTFDPGFNDDGSGDDGQALDALLEPNETLESQNGNFQFNTDIFHNENFQVVVHQQPTGQECEVNQGFGTINDASVTNIAVSCDPLIFTVGGNLEGLIEGRSVKIQIETSVEGGEPIFNELTLTENAGYVFPTPVVFDNPYAVTVTEQPAGMNCTVENGSDVIGPDHVTNANVICEPLPFKVIPTISGIIASREIQVQVSFPNVAHFFNTTENETFDEFPPGLSDQTYLVTVSQRPLGHTCEVLNETGRLFDSDITDVEVNCTPTPFNLSGNVSGVITGRDLSIQLNGEETLSFTADGAINFETQLLTGQLYNVTITQTPIGETCEVLNGSGEIIDGNITNISVECEPIPFNVGGALAGLIGGRTLGLSLNDGFSDLNVIANGAYVFADKVLAGETYSVSIASQPIGQTCSIAEGTESGTIIGSDITDIDIVCVPLPFAVGGNVTGLISQRSFTLVLNGEIEVLSIDANGTFEFENKVLSGETYTVSVGDQPPGMECEIGNSTGTILGSDINNVNVVCEPLPFEVGGTIAGIIADREISLQILVDGQATVETFENNGEFEFENSVLSGKSFVVSVATQPLGHTCDVTNESGTIFDADISNVSVNCEPIEFNISGTQSGLIAGRTVTIALDGVEGPEESRVLTSEDTAFAFETTFLTGEIYSVIVTAQPPGMDCSIANASTEIIDSDITNVAVTCEPLPFLVGGNVAGLIDDRTIELTLNSDVDSVSVTGEPEIGGDFVFEIPVLSGETYLVQISQQPVGMSCDIENNSGEIFDADITDISITCSPLPFSVGFTVTGLISERTFDVRLLSNGQTVEDLGVQANDFFNFTNKINSGQPYEVVVSAQPPGQNCTLENATGTILGNDITDVIVTCEPLPFTVTGAVSGILGQAGTVTVRVSSSDTNFQDFQLANEEFTSFEIDSGLSFTVTVESNAPNHTCSVENGEGDIFDSNIDNVAVTCEPVPFPVGGILDGLHPGHSITLQNNEGDDLVLTANGEFTFATQVPFFSPYSVTISSPPDFQDCEIVNGSGTVLAEVSDIEISCDPPVFPHNLTVTGIETSETLSYQLVKASNGDAVSNVTTGNVQNLALGFLPLNLELKVRGTDLVTGHDCTVSMENAIEAPFLLALADSDDSFTVNSGAVNVTINCVPQTFLVNVDVEGIIDGRTVTLVNNHSDQQQDTLTTGVDTSFSTEVAFLQPFDVTISQNPAGQNCTVTNGSGVMGTQDVTVNVDCVPLPFSIGVNVTGLIDGRTLEVTNIVNQVNDNLVVETNGETDFTDSVNSGEVFNVSIVLQPVGQNCSIAQGDETGEVIDQDILVDVTCIPIEFSIGGTATGVPPGNAVELSNTSAGSTENLLVSANGEFNFPTKVASGEDFSVEIVNEPIHHSCTVTGGTGTVLDQDITTPVVSCVQDEFTVGGTVTGLADGTNLVVNLNETESLSISGDSTGNDINFTFSATLTNQQSYGVFVETQPEGQTCEIENGDGTIDQSNITDVTVTCEETPLIAVGEIDSSFNNNVGSVTVDVGSEAFPNLTLDSQERLAFAFQTDAPVAQTLVMCRVNSDGTTDPTFNGGSCKSFDQVAGFSDVIPNDLKVDPTTDDLFVAGNHQTTNMFVGRVGEDGAGPVSTFGSNGIQLITNTCEAGPDEAFGLVLDALGDIFSVGRSNTVEGFEAMAWWKLGNADGVLDDTFDNNSDLPFAGAACLDLDSTQGDPERAFEAIVDSQGRLVTVGAAGEFLGHIVRMNATTGALDTQFSGDGVARLNTGQRDSANAIVEDSSGRYVIAGTNGSNALLMRLNTFGNPDPSFNGSGTPFQFDLGAGESGEVIHKVFLDQAENIVVVGSDTTNNAGFVARFDADGFLDTTFATNGILIVPGRQYVDAAMDSVGNIYVISTVTNSDEDIIVEKIK